MEYKKLQLSKLSENELENFINFVLSLNENEQLECMKYFVSKYSLSGFSWFDEDSEFTASLDKLYKPSSVKVIFIDEFENNAIKKFLSDRRFYGLRTKILRDVDENAFLKMMNDLKKLNKNKNLV